MTPTLLTGRKTVKAWLVRVVPALAADRIDVAAQFLDEDVVGATQQVGGLPDLAQNAQWPSPDPEGMAVDHVARQAQRDAELAHLVLNRSRSGSSSFSPSCSGSRRRCGGD